MRRNKFTDRKFYFMFSRLAELLLTTQHLNEESADSTSELKYKDLYRVTEKPDSLEFRIPLLDKLKKSDAKLRRCCSNNELVELPQILDM